SLENMICSPIPRHIDRRPVPPQQLTVKDTADLDLLEISGLGQRHRPDGRGLQVLAVGDDEFTILVADLEVGVTPRQFHRLPLEDVLSEGEPTQGSQWEAADGDASGRVFVLQEEPAVVFVLNPAMDDLVTRITLANRTPEGDDFALGTSPNSQGEGLVLLRNGHILVAKEKDPPVLMEYGPSEERPEGLAPDLLFATSDEFPLPQEQRTEFSLLTIWRLSSSAGKAIKDISDIAVGPDAGLYLLSDESACIAQLKRTLDPAQEHLEVASLWNLPPEIEQPEGLVVTGDRTPLVAIDSGERSRNLFVLSSLE
ncbi:MAG: SdiA-regulated domain-containing protein, partial [Actinomycetota bacterium]|nr:SdiA-regulated domain-containing protein [Actinomycetota bacterium]